MMNIQQKRDLLMSLPLMEQEQRWIMERLDTLSVKEQYQLSAAILRTGKLEELAGKTGWELQTAILHMDPKVAVDAVNCLLSLEDYQICFPAGSYAQLGSFYLRHESHLPERAMYYADLEALGRRYEDRHSGLFVGNCYTVAVSIEDLEVIYQNIRSTMGVEATEDQRSNAESIYSLIRYGYTGGSSFEGADVPFIGADGFCSPIGENWRSVVTSEFGNRIDPITGQRRGHTGMDLAVPTGTPIRAALPGTVTVSTYNRGGYGYYIMIDHGDGLSTLYGHCSQLLASVGRIVNAGDVVALSGSTGRSTGPHLHFEVRVNGQRTNPRGYLP